MTAIHPQTDNTINDPITTSHDHQFLPYKHLRADHLQQLSTLLQDTTTAAVEKQSLISSTLRDILLPTDHTQLTPAQQAAITELLYITYTYTLQHFTDSELKQSTFVSLVLSIIEYTVQRTLCPSDTSKIAKHYQQHSTTPLPSLSQIVQYTDTLILQHSIERPPYSIGVFSLGDMKCVSEFLLQHVFSGVDMWQYVFHR